jgi:hypothetical protein
MFSTRSIPAFLGGLLLALLLSPFVLARVVGEGILVDGRIALPQFFGVIASMSVVLLLIVAVGFFFRSWRAAAWGLLVGIPLPWLFYWLGF